METSGIWNHVSRATTWTRVRGKFGANRSKKSGRSDASFTSQKNNASVTHFFLLSPKPIARFRWKRARLSLFRPQPQMPSFIQIHPSFRDLLAKTTFQLVTMIVTMSILKFLLSPRPLASMFERNIGIYVPPLLIPWHRIRRRSNVDSWKQYIL